MGLWYPIRVKFSVVATLRTKKATSRVTTTRRPAAKRTSSNRRAVRTSSAAAISHPYHPQGELTLLLSVAALSLVFLLLPTPVFVRLFGSILLLLILPTALLREYWPKVQLHDLGWQAPQHPRMPHLYSIIVTVISFLPLAVFLLVDHPTDLIAVDATIPWIPWLLAEGIVAMMVIAQAAFFTGLLLFRLAHLVRPGFAIIIVALILAVGQFFLPGVVRYIALPLTLALTWMAWQTRSFVPVAVTQIAMTFIFDLIVRLTA